MHLMQQLHLMKRAYQRRLFLMACFKDCLLNLCRFFCGRHATAATHHNDPLVTSHTEHCIIAGRPSCSRIHKHENITVDGRKLANHVEHDVKMRGTKKLLGGVKTQSGQLALDQIRPVLHHLPKSRMTCPRLPPAKPHENREDLSDRYWQYHLLFDMEMEDT